jgi:hypothetical protein
MGIFDQFQAQLNALPRVSPQAPRQGLLGGVQNFLAQNRGQGNFVDRLGVFGAQLQDISDGGSRARQIQADRQAQEEARQAAQQQAQAREALNAALRGMSPAQAAGVQPAMAQGAMNAAVPALRQATPAAASMPMQAQPPVSDIPAPIRSQIELLIGQGNIEAATTMLGEYRQQQAAMASLPEDIRNDPRMSWLASTNPDAFTAAVAQQYSPQVIAEGAAQRVAGTNQVFRNPRTREFGTDLVRDTENGVQVIASRGPTPSEQAALLNANTVNVAPGGQVYRDGQLYAENTAPRPMSDSDQTAITKAEERIALLDTSLSRAAEIDRQIQAGELNLNPVANTISGLRNAAGVSDQNSLNYDALLSWAREARNAILQANTGVQTDQDAVRELETILSGTRDERIVQAALRRFQEARRATRNVFQRDITRRTGGQAAPSGRNAPPPPPGFVLD